MEKHTNTQQTGSQQAGSERNEQNRNANSGETFNNPQSGDQWDNYRNRSLSGNENDQEGLRENTSGSSNSQAGQ